LTGVLGLELNKAIELLAREGVGVTCVETASRKGLAGNEKRVVRQRPTGGNSVELVYAVFRTDVDYNGEGSEK